MSKSRLISLIAALAIFISMVSAFSFSAMAKAEEKGGFPNIYENTGDQRKDIIGVALSQLGYKEGGNNDTKYGDWYGLPYNPWCAMFISWCADQADIPTTILKKSALASPAVSCFNIERRIGSQYTPLPGDLFFTKSNSHVGLVYYVEGEYFYSLEGNSNSSGSSDGDGVVSIKRKIINYDYGVPKYTEGYTLTVQYNAGEGIIEGSDKTNDQYKVKSIDGINLRSSAGTTYSIVTALPKDTLFIVSETKEADGYTWGKTVYDGMSGWCVISMNWTEMIRAVPQTTYYLDQTGLILESATGKAKSMALKAEETNESLFPKQADFGLEPKQKGKAFAGWAISSSDGNYFAPGSMVTTEELYGGPLKKNEKMVLYAVWIENNHTHKFTQYIDNRDSTATKDGTETATCSCGATHTRLKENSKLQDSSKVFKDVPANAWYKHYIDYTYTYKIMVGNGAGEAQPQKQMTRAEFVQLLASLSGVDTKDRNVDTAFKDVKAGAWYAPAVKWASDQGIVSGYGDGIFAPNSSITREQMCSILVRYAKSYLKMNLPDAKNPDLFADDAQIASWARADIYTCKEAQIISGVSETEFNPKGVATRAEVATMISRFHQNHMK